MKTKRLVSRLCNYLKYVFEVLWLYFRILNRSNAKKIEASWLSIALALIAARSLLKAVYDSPVKSLRDFRVEMERTRSDDPEAHQVVITFYGIKSTKCLCIRQEYPCLSFLIRTVTDSGHSVYKPMSVRRTFLEGFIGDILEEFHSIKNARGLFHASFWVFWQMAKSYIFFRALLSSVVEIAKWVRKIL